ncbi:MAG: hypothetical protein K5756_05995 [Clostridiales bacterium]|nr:hypothetical protein [Clostridiales bacterium]
MIKRLSALFVTLILIFSFSLISYSASADVSASTVYGKAGGKVTVVVKLNTNPGFACLRLFAEYDANALELINAYDEGLMGISSYKDLGKGKYSFQWGEKGERHLQYTDTGELVSIAFRIKNNAKAAKYDIKLSYDRDCTDDINAEPISLNITNGAVIVVGEGETVPPPTTRSTSTTAPGGNQGGSTTKPGNTVKPENTTKPASTTKPVSTTKSGSTATPENTSEPYSGQGSTSAATTGQNGETSPAVIHYTEIAVTDQDGSTVYTQVPVSVTDENGSVVPEIAGSAQEEKTTSETDTDSSAPGSGNTVKIIIVVVVLLLACALIFFLATRSKKQKNEQE